MLIDLKTSLKHLVACTHCFFDQREQPDVSAFLEGAFLFVETKDCVGEYCGSFVDGKPHGSGTLLLSPHLYDVYKGTF